MISGFVLLTALAISNEPYARSRTEPSDPLSHCTFWVQNTKIIYTQSALGNDELAGDAEFTAINNAFASWQAKLAACSSLSLQEAARSSSRKIGWIGGRSDNENLMLFRSKKCDGLPAANDNCWIDDDCGNKFDCWQYTPEALAITTSNYDPKTGRLLDVDIEFDQANYIFTTVNSPVCPRDSSNRIQCALDCVCTDIQNTATHEIGHLLGLDHTTAAGSIMVPRADPGELSKRTIDGPSGQFVCDVYPRGEVSKDCITTLYSDVLGKAEGCGCSSLAAPAWLGAWGAYALVRRRRARSP